MEEKGIGSLVQSVKAWLVGSVTILCLFGASQAQADFNLSVVDQNGSPVSSYKWVLEEDTTFEVNPGVQTRDTLANSFQNSYTPVVASGEQLSGATAVIIADPAKRYYISVTAFGGTEGYTITGAQVAIGQTAVSVDVHTLPIPTALISVLVFPDFIVNGAQDAPQEVAQPNPAEPNYFDPSKFTILVFEGGGRYGVTGGLVSQDAFGNPLGTTYDVTGNVATLGTNVLTPDPVTGKLIIRNLSPAKYGIQVVPPAGEGWQQTSTIEGGKTVDAWVQANEATFFAEIGPPGQHVFIGFVKPTNTLAGGANTITGEIVNQHMARPPAVDFQPGNPFPGCWIALIPGLVEGAQAEYVEPCNDDSTFAINGVPDGNYTLVVWDTNLNVIIASRPVAVPAESNLGQVQVFNWFARLQTVVFFDRNENGFRDCITPTCEDPVIDDVPMPEQNINIRFRDGTIYQAFPTDLAGEVPFDEIFPFFHWLVVEVDFARFKATGVTYAVDAGGLIPPDNGWITPSRDVLNPQIQPAFNAIAGSSLSRTLNGGPVLTLGMQAFLGQTNLMEFGKANYAAGENGGVSGVVFYAITRAEDDPRYAAAEEWEPGIPRVPVNLYLDANDDSIIDDLNQDGVVTLADVDFFPFGWVEGGAHQVRYPV